MGELGRINVSVGQWFLRLMFLGSQGAQRCATSIR